MKVIFLDIDGVLCSMRSSAALGGYPAAGNPTSWGKFDDVAIRLLQEAIRQTGAVIVLSSSWRNDVNREALQWRLGIRIEDVTRYGAESEPRGVQIHDWLLRNPGVTEYAILDDDEDMLQDQMPRLCRTSKRNGFLLAHYEELIKLLDGRASLPSD